MSCSRYEWQHVHGRHPVPPALRSSVVPWWNTTFSSLLSFLFPLRGKMSASAGWGAPSLILLLLSKQEVQEQRQSTSFAFSFAEKEVLSFKVSKWKTCWLSFFNLLGDKQTKEVLFFNVLTAIVPKTIFFKLRDSTERKSKDFAIWTGMIETVLRKVYIEI